MSPLVNPLSLHWFLHGRFYPSNPTCRSTSHRLILSPTPISCSPGNDGRLCSRPFKTADIRLAIWLYIRVCVYRLNRRKTSSLYYIIYGRGQRDLQLWPLPTKLHTGDQVNVPACPALGVFKTQLGGHNICFAVVLYCHCPL